MGYVLYVYKLLKPAGHIQDDCAYSSEAAGGHKSAEAGWKLKKKQSRYKFREEQK